MAKVRTTLTIEEAVLRVVKVRAARTGRRSSDLIEEAVRRDLGLDTLQRLSAGQDMEPAEAEALAVEAQQRVRRPGR